jgi:F-type H+-transporting ATPase subunit g
MIHFPYILYIDLLCIALQKPIVYNAKVAGEIAKQVYVKEGMAFPNGAQFAQAQQSVQSALKIKNLKSLTFSDVAKGSVLFAEVYTFFLIGEIVGRRNLIGYNVKSEEAHEH